MKFTPITERLPQLDRPILVNIQYEGCDYVEITETELYNNPNSTINPCFNMGSAKNYKIFSWAYIPKAQSLPTYITYHAMEWNQADRTWDQPRTITR